MISQFIDAKEIQTLFRDTSVAARAPITSIIKSVSEQTGVSVGAIKGRSKVRAVARARQLVMYRAHRQHGFSLNQVGRVLDRDHSSVLCGVRRIEKLMAERLRQ